MASYSQGKPAFEQGYQDGLYGQDRSSSFSGEHHASYVSGLQASVLEQAFMGPWNNLQGKRACKPQHAAH